MISIKSFTDFEKLSQHEMSGHICQPGIMLKNALTTNQPFHLHPLKQGYIQSVHLWDIFTQLTTFSNQN